jgi:hypothetical protein
MSHAPVSSGRFRPGWWTVANLATVLARPENAVAASAALNGVGSAVGAAVAKTAVRTLRGSAESRAGSVRKIVSVAWPDGPGLGAWDGHTRTEHTS